MTPIFGGKINCRSPNANLTDDARLHLHPTRRGEDAAGLPQRQTDRQNGNATMIMASNTEPQKIREHGRLSMEYTLSIHKPGTRRLTWQSDSQNGNASTEREAAPSLMQYKLPGQCKLHNIWKLHVPVEAEYTIEFWHTFKPRQAS